VYERGLEGVDGVDAAVLASEKAADVGVSIALVGADHLCASLDLEKIGAGVNVTAPWSLAAEQSSVVPVLTLTLRHRSQTMLTVSA
jgi:hypothetical protein